MVLSFTVSQRPKLARQKWPKQLLHTIQRVCISAYVSLSAISGAEGVNVEALMGKIGLMSCLNYFRIVLSGLDWQHQLGSQIGIIHRDTSSIKPTHTTQSCTYVHMHTCTHMLMTALTHPLPPLGIRSPLGLLNERSLRLDGYSFSWGWRVYFWLMSWIVCNCYTAVVFKIYCLWIEGAE